MVTPPKPANPGAQDDAAAAAPRPGARADRGAGRPGGRPPAPAARAAGLRCDGGRSALRRLHDPHVRRPPPSQAPWHARASVLLHTKKFVLGSMRLRHFAECPGECFGRTKLLLRVGWWSCVWPLLETGSHWFKQLLPMHSCRNRLKVMKFWSEALLSSVAAPLSSLPLSQVETHAVQVMQGHTCSGCHQA